MRHSNYWNEIVSAIESAQKTFDYLRITGKFPGDLPESPSKGRGGPVPTPTSTHQEPSQKRTGELLGRKSRKMLAQFPIFLVFFFFKTTNCFMKIQFWEQVKLSTRLKITGGGFFFHSPLPFNNFRVWDSNILHCLTSLCIRKLWVLFLVCFSQTSVKSSCCKLSLFSFRKYA